MRSKRISPKKDKSILPKLVFVAVLAIIGVAGVFYLAGQAEKKAPPVTEIRMEATNVEIR